MSLVKNIRTNWSVRKGFSLIMTKKYTISLLSKPELVMASLMLQPNATSLFGFNNIFLRSYLVLPLTYFLVNINFPRR